MTASAISSTGSCDHWAGCEFNDGISLLSAFMIGWLLGALAIITAGWLPFRGSAHGLGVVGRSMLLLVCAAVASTAIAFGALGHPAYEPWTVSLYLAPAGAAVANGLFSLRLASRPERAIDGAATNVG